MDSLPQKVDRALDEGEYTRARAKALRERLRKNLKPGQNSREKDLAGMIREINVAMEPIRSLIGQSMWTLIPREDEVRDLSKRLQYERKQLKKMVRAK